MSTKWMRVTISCLVAFIALACANPRDHDKVSFAQWELAESLEKLDEYLESNYVRDDGRRLEESKKVMEQSSANHDLLIAAQMVVDLKELDRCTPRVLKYVQLLINDRLDLMDRQNVPYRLESMLEDGVERVKPLCKSFMNSWHDQSEGKIESASKEKLYNFYTSEVIAECDKTTSNNDVADSILLMKAVKRDANASNKFAELKTEPQFIEFYQAYWEENVLKPCKKFMEAMSGVMDQGFRFKLGYRPVELFDPPSERYIESLFRYGRCRNPQQRTVAEMAARQSLSGDEV